MVSKEERLLELMERWYEGERSGQPSGVEELCAGCPELADELRQHIDEARWLERLAGGEETARDTGGCSDASPPTVSWVPEIEGRQRSLPSVPGYEGLEFLGGGGMGIVYRARDVRLDRVVALKLVRAERLTPEMLARLQAEARAVARLDHPHIVKVHAVGECSLPEGGAAVPYIALEYVAGGSLEKRLARQVLPPAEAGRLVMLLARAVHHAHERGIVHRDLKPDNVLLAPATSEPALNTALGCPKITDFGLARQARSERRLTGAGVAVGTPAYMAPEQAEGSGDVGPTADVWALGVILYRCLTGQLPFEAPGVVELLYKVCHQQPGALHELRPEVPAELERICLDCLLKDPTQRPTAPQLADRLERCLAAAGPQSETTVLPRMVRKPARRRLVLAALVGLVLLGVVFGLARVATRPGSKGEQETTTPAVVKPAAPLRIKQLLVNHYEEPDIADPVERGAIGEKSFAARFKDSVILKVVLSEPGYFYLIGFNFNGKEQLIWPANASGEGDEGTAPPRVERLHFPPNSANRLYLVEDDAKSGLQAYAVAASRQPLPAYREWRKGRDGVSWKALPAGKVVWQADPDWVSAVVPGKGLGRGGQRGKVKGAKGVPPLQELCQALRGGGVEVVEAIAFGVQAREDK